MKTRRHIHIFQDAGAIALHLKQIIEQQVDICTDKRFVDIALSGGTTPKSVFKVLSSKAGQNISWDKVRLFWGDERCVHPESDESNYKMACVNLIDQINIPKENIFRIRGENDALIESGRYQKIVRDLLKTDNDLPQFDIFLLGLGDDGHTASIFPGNMHLFDSIELYTPVEYPYSRQQRITASGKLINNAARVIFMVTGKNKAHMVDMIVKQQKEAENLPAFHIRPISGEVHWLIDIDAASDLDKFYLSGQDFFIMD